MKRKKKKQNQCKNFPFIFISSIFNSSKPTIYSIRVTPFENKTTNDHSRKT